MFKVNSIKAPKYGREIIKIYIEDIEDYQSPLSGEYTIKDNHLLNFIKLSYIKDRPIKRIILDDPLSNLIIGVQYENK